MGRSISLVLTDWRSEGHVATQPGPIGMLAIEKPQMIFVEVDDSEFHDMICLASTCKFLLDVSRPYLEEAYRACHAGTWCGSRLIYLGDGANDEHLPAGLLTPAERPTFTSTATLLTPSIRPLPHSFTRGYTVSLEGSSIDFAQSDSSPRGCRPATARTVKGRRWPKTVT